MENTLSHKIVGFLLLTLMNKLRLIKPWHLQAIHQRLETVRNEEVALSIIPCTGPVGVCIQEPDPRQNNPTTTYNKLGHAPVSDVIFASGNNNIR